MRFSSTEEGLHRVHLQELNTRFRIPEWLLLLAFCVFFFFWQLSSFGLIGADEARYAQVAREMSARRDWITPTLGSSAWLEKPPLYYWQAMLAYRVFGVSDWAARLPSVIDAFVLVIAVYAFLRRSRPGFELDGALMLATAAGIVGYARAASMEMALAAMFTIAMLAWYAWFVSGSRKYLATAYIFLLRSRETHFGSPVFSPSCWRRCLGTWWCSSGIRNSSEFLFLNTIWRASGRTFITTSSLSGITSR